MFRESHATRERALGPAVSESVDVEDIGVRVRRRVAARQRTRAFVSTGILTTLVVGAVVLTQVTRGSPNDDVATPPDPTASPSPALLAGIPGAQELTPEVVATIDENWVAATYMVTQDNRGADGPDTLRTYALYVASPDGAYYEVAAPVRFGEDRMELVRFDPVAKTILVAGASLRPEPDGFFGEWYWQVQMVFDLTTGTTSEQPAGVPDVGPEARVTFLGRSGTSTVWTADYVDRDERTRPMLTLVAPDGTTTFIPDAEGVGPQPVLNTDGTRVADAAANGVEGFDVTDLSAGVVIHFEWPRYPFCSVSSWTDATHLLVECEGDAVDYVRGEVIKVDRATSPAGVFSIDVTTGAAELVYETGQDDEVFGPVFEVAGELVGGTQPVTCAIRGEAAVFDGSARPFDLTGADLSVAERPEAIGVRGSSVYFHTSALGGGYLASCEQPRDSSVFRLDADTGEVVVMLPRASVVYGGEVPELGFQLHQVLLAD